MADVVRTIADIQALLADNQAEDILPQDTRDMLVTLQIKYGELYVTSSTATTISDTTNYFDVAGTWTLGEMQQFDENVSGQLRYTGTPTIEVIIFGELSATVAGNNDTIHLEFRKNGVDIDGSDADVKIGTGADVQGLTIFGITSMANNDYLTLAVRNESATENITAVEGHILAVGVAK